jgi:transcriptional regulator of nitric oxide reductase
MTTTELNTANQFQTANRGRPPGSKNKATMLVEALNKCDPDALQVLVEKTFNAAKDGKPWAIQLLLDRVYPALKERAVSFDLRHIETVADVAAALDDVLQAVANGELTPSEAASIADLIRSYADPVVKTEQARLMLEHKKLGQH